jgi:phosphoglycolate phosphatase-like HAD superfamily hydrolase
VAENNLTPRNRLLLWDIDGTLVKTSRPGSLNPHVNALMSLGYSVNNDLIDFSGSTDYEVILEILKKNKIVLRENKLREIFIEIDKEAQKLDLISEFNLYPGVRNMLDELSALEWTHGILTGNTYRRMISKLESSNIKEYFLNDLMFGCNFGDSRENICKNALRLIDKNLYQRIYIIGDTPKDISAARAIGRPAISVASGNYSSSDLAMHTPDLLIRNLKLDAKLLIDYLGK